VRCLSRKDGPLSRPDLDSSRKSLFIGSDSFPGGLSRITLFRPSVCPDVFRLLTTFHQSLRSLLTFLLHLYKSILTLPLTTSCHSPIPSNRLYAVTYRSTFSYTLFKNLNPLHPSPFLSLISPPIQPTLPFPSPIPQPQSNPASQTFPPFHRALSQWEKPV
jgi:hypothetical protein